VPPLWRTRELPYRSIDHYFEACWRLKLTTSHILRGIAPLVHSTNFLLSSPDWLQCAIYQGPHLSHQILTLEARSLSEARQPALSTNKNKLVNGIQNEESRWPDMLRHDVTEAVVVIAVTVQSKSGSRVGTCAPWPLSWDGQADHFLEASSNRAGFNPKRYRCPATRLALADRVRRTGSSQPKEQCLPAWLRNSLCGLRTLTAACPTAAMLPNGSTYENPSPAPTRVASTASVEPPANRTTAPANREANRLEVRRSLCDISNALAGQPRVRSRVL
jgi:hypothetical protein